MIPEWQECTGYGWMVTWHRSHSCWLQESIDKRELLCCKGLGYKLAVLCFLTQAILSFISFTLNARAVARPAARRRDFRLDLAQLSSITRLTTTPGFSRTAFFSSGKPVEQEPMFNIGLFLLQIAVIIGFSRLIAHAFRR